MLLPERHRVLLKDFQDELAEAQEQARLPEVGGTGVQDQLRCIDSLQTEIEPLDKRLA